MAGQREGVAVMVVAQTLWEREIQETGEKSSHVPGSNQSLYLNKLETLFARNPYVVRRTYIGHAIPSSLPPVEWRNVIRGTLRKVKFASSYHKRYLR